MCLAVTGNRTQDCFLKHTRALPLQSSELQLPKHNTKNCLTTPSVSVYNTFSMVFSYLNNSRYADVPITKPYGIITITIITTVLYSTQPLFVWVVCSQGGGWVGKGWGRCK